MLGQQAQVPARPRPVPRRVALIVVALSLLAPAQVDQLRAARSREAEALRLVVTGVRPTATASSGSLVQDARVALTLRNDGPSRVRVLEQRLDGGGPSDPGPDVAAGASAELAVRWRVLCSEIGGLYGPQALDLRVGLRGGGVRLLRLPLGPPTGQLRRGFRVAGADACASVAS